MPKATKSWDATENEAQNSFLTWGKPGNFFLGTLIGKKQVKSTLADKVGQLQWIYEVKVRECIYNKLDDKKNAIEPEIVCESEEIISIGGRTSIDSRMARIKIGQVFGLKYLEDGPPVKGRSPYKAIRVFTPKNESGEFEMDEEFLASKEAEDAAEAAFNSVSSR